MSSTTSPSEAKSRTPILLVSLSAVLVCGGLYLSRDWSSLEAAQPLSPLTVESTSSAVFEGESDSPQPSDKDSTLKLLPGWQAVHPSTSHPTYIPDQNTIPPEGMEPIVAALGTPRILSFRPDLQNKQRAFFQVNRARKETLHVRPRMEDFNGSFPESHRNLFNEFILSPSYPRSGSSYTYLLMEGYTGMVSGAVYEEHKYFKNGGLMYNPPFSQYHRQHVFPVRELGPEFHALVKTHYPVISVRMNELAQQPSRLVRMVRHPVDAALAYAFWDYKHPEPEAFLEHMRKYLNFMEYWDFITDSLYDFGKIPLLVYRYEDLCLYVDDIAPMIAEFLDRPGSDKYPSISKNGSFPMCNGHIGHRIKLLDKDTLNTLLDMSQDFVTKYGYEDLTEVYRTLTSEL